MHVFSCTFALNYNALLMQGKWDVPLPKVKAMSDAEVFKVIRTGKSKSMYSSASAYITTG